MHDADRTYQRQSLLQLPEERHVEQREGWQTIDATLYRRIDKFFCLNAIYCDGFLHDDVLAGHHRLHRIFVVHMVGVGNIDKVGLSFLKHASVVCVDEACWRVSHAEVDGVFNAFLACIDASHLNLSLKILVQKLQHFFGDFPCSSNRNLHCSCG